MSRGDKSKPQTDDCGTPADSERPRPGRTRITPTHDARNLLNEPIPERLQKLVDQMRKHERKKR